MSTKVITKANRTPIKNRIYDLQRVNLTWWLSHEERGFAIDRNVESCRTPRRNKDVDDALEFHQRFYNWCNAVKVFLSQVYAPEEGRSLCVAETVSPSLVPWMENSTLLSLDTLDQLLDHEGKALDQRLDMLKQHFPTAEKGIIWSVDEATLDQILCSLLSSLSQYSMNVDYVEEVMRRRLYSAVGRHLSAADFDEYMIFHNRKIFADQYAPKYFSHAVRQPGQFPVGSLMIEQETKEFKIIQTFSRRIPGTNHSPIAIPLDAATSVELTGDRVLSGWIRYQFSSEEGPTNTRLVARARQFSSFMLLIGKMTSPHSFDPEHAIVLQNMDEVFIDLLAEALPSAREFNDVIASLSPEQQDFAKAFRAMQLESSVFALCLVQLKPQLELLLNLPVHALAKEIKLTEDLMSLFINYQIPSDLLSYEGPADRSATDKIEAVRTHVNKVLQMITATKKEQLKEERGRDEMYRAKYHTSSSQTVMASSETPPTSSQSSVSSNGAGESARAASAQATSRRLRSVPLEVASLQVDSGLAGATARPPEGRQKQRQQSETSNKGGVAAVSEDGSDFTSIPDRLDSLLEKLDTEAYLRSTILSVHPTSWLRKSKPDLLSPTIEESIGGPGGMSAEKKKAFDLLDALSRSGTLPIASAELHVVIGMTHCFDRSLIETVIRDNINPISKAEKSGAMVASVIHHVSPAELFDDADTRQQLAEIFPELFTKDM